jgi:hypothetical protein
MNDWSFSNGFSSARSWSGGSEGVSECEYVSEGGDCMTCCHLEVSHPQCNRLQINTTSTRSQALYETMHFYFNASNNFVGSTQRSNCTLLHRILSWRWQSHDFQVLSEHIVHSPWQLTVAVGITESQDFVLRPKILNNQKTRRFGNWICSRPQVRGERYLLCWVP